MNPVISNQDWPGMACLWIQALSGYTSGLFHRKKHIFSTAHWAKNPWSRSQHARGVKLLLFCFAKLIASSCRLNLYTHRWVQLSDLVREVSLCSSWQLLTHKPTPGQSEETVWLWRLGSPRPQTWHLHHTPLLKTQKPSQKKGQKACKSQGSGRTRINVSPGHHRTLWSWTQVPSKHGWERVFVSPHS